MRNKNGNTPKDEARILVAEWIERIHNEDTADLRMQNWTIAFDRNVKKELAHIREKLLKSVKADYEPLG